jgi:PKD repeat protein
LDGEPFLNPPSIGCDEIIATNTTGPLSFSFLYYATNALAYHRVFFASEFEGRPAELDWNFGDGPTATNLGAYLTHTWTNAGTYTMTLTAYNADHPSGVSSSVVVTVDPFLSPSIQSAGVVTNVFQFSFAAQGQGLYNVQYATNLTAPVAWQNLQVFLFSTSNTVMTVSDPAITNSQRFYRVFGQ